MLDLDQINGIYKEAGEKKWSYPQLFDALKGIGVERYEVTVSEHEIKYVGGGASLSASAPAGFSPITVAKKFNLDGLKAALKRVQSQQTNYEQFLKEIAEAGVPFYRVDMRPRTVTYHGPTPKDKLVESVPVVQ